MRRIIWLLPLGACAWHAPSDHGRALLQRELDAYRAQGHFNGGVLAASFGDGTLIVVSSGNVSPDTPMLAGSITKTFVAARALQLVGEGRLQLDEPVATSLASKPWVGRVPNGQRVTIRMLLSHTSGYGDCQRDVGSHWDAIQCLLDTPPVDEPGRAFRYSGMNYNLLAAIEESVTADSSANDLAEHIFKPLGLTRTSVNDSVADWGSASVVSSAGGRGLGIEVDSEAAGRTIGHGGLFNTGASTGYRSEVRYYLDQDLALAIMVNTNGDLPGWRREPLARIAAALASSGQTGH